MGYRCENQPGTWGVEGPRGVKHTPMYEQLELTHLFCCGLETVFKVLEKGLEKVWNSDASKEREP